MHEICNRSGAYRNNARARAYFIPIYRLEVRFFSWATVVVSVSAAVAATATVTAHVKVRLFNNFRLLNYILFIYCVPVFLSLVCINAELLPPPFITAPSSFAVRFTKFLESNSEYCIRIRINLQCKTIFFPRPCAQSVVQRICD